MTRFNFIIRPAYAICVAVDAENYSEAYDKVSEAWASGEINVNDNRDYGGHDIEQDDYADEESADYIISADSKVTEVK